MPFGKLVWWVPLLVGVMLAVSQLFLTRTGYIVSGVSCGASTEYPIRPGDVVVDCIGESKVAARGVPRAYGYCMGDEESSENGCVMYGNSSTIALMNMVVLVLPGAILLLTRTILQYRKERKNS